MQNVKCNLCGANETFLAAIQNDYRMVACRRCGLVYANPRPAPEALIALYNTYHQRNGKGAETWGTLMEQNFREVSSLLNLRFPDKGRLLDIGCGYGHFMAMMQGHGWKVSGMEPSEKASAYALAKGLDVSRTVIEQAGYPEASFAAVTAFYVLEHLFDPLVALIKILALLKQGGVLVLRIPHTTPIVKLLDSLGISNNLYDMPFHLYDFSPKTIRLMLEKAGFENIRVTPGRPTTPPRRSEQAVSLVSGNTARMLFLLSGGRILLPGVSKTITAIKPMNSEGHSA